MTLGSDFILVAHVLGAFGIKGEIRLKVYTDDPLAILSYGPLKLGETEKYLSLVRARGSGQNVIAVAREISDRTTAQLLKGFDLFIPRAALPEPEPEEYYLSDLIGLDVMVRRKSSEVCEAEDVCLGKVRAVEDFGAGPILDIFVRDGEDFMVVFSKDNVPDIDLAQGFLCLSPLILPEDQALQLSKPTSQ